MTIMTKTPEWIPVGALGDAFAPDNHCLPQTDSLDGRTVSLHYEDGGSIACAFGPGNALAWNIDGAGASTGSKERCSITRPREGIYFVDFVQANDASCSVSLVLDFETGSFIELTGKLPNKEEAFTPMLERVAKGQELTGVSLRIRRGSIDRPYEPGSAVPAPSTDLLGKRVEYLYSPHERYEHIYLNDRFYTWRCIEGSERGLTDTDACDYYKIDTDLYLFIWREKIIPTLGVIMIDLRAMKTTGKIMGYEGRDFAAVRNFSVGAHVKFLSKIPAE